MKRTILFLMTLAIAVLAFALPAYADDTNLLGEGVTVNHIVVSENAAIAITECPAYGDRTPPYPFIYGQLNHGDTFDYETITIINVNGSYYGKKPFNDFPNGFIKPDGTFSVQFSSNDGVGVDWQAEEILIFLVPSGYEDGIRPDANAGYVIPPAQISALKKDSVCVVQIIREPVVD